MKKLIKYVVSTLFITMMFGCNVFASETEVIKIEEVLYSNENAVLYSEADLNSIVVLTAEAFPDNTPLQVTGITYNGFFQIDLNGIHYVPLLGLKNAPTTEVTTDSSKFNLDLGNGVAFISDRYIEDYVMSSYKGKIEVLKIKYDAFKPSDFLYSAGGFAGEISVQYSAGEYANGSTQVAANILFLDADGFELGSRIILAHSSTDDVGEKLTLKTYVPVGTSVITVTNQ